MKAMVLDRIVSLHDCSTPLRLADLPLPVPEAGEVLLKVHACGVCHTELDEIAPGFFAARSRPPGGGHGCAVRGGRFA
jgi:D-arabinose 1-dehydrogenase-like Zn-dependent alcohol dehydrogenase